jgi:hypothetical protein
MVNPYVYVLIAGFVWLAIHMWRMDGKTQHRSRCTHHLPGDCAVRNVSKYRKPEFHDAEAEGWTP